MEQTNKNAAFFILGTTAGLLLTALFTPKNGKQIRGQIKDTFVQKKQSAEDKLEDVEAEILEARDNAVDRLNTANMTGEGLTE